MLDSLKETYDAISAFYNTDLALVRFWGLTLHLEIGKIIGWSGSFLFTGRWIIQMLASKKSGKPVLPLLFWYLSITGSLLMLSYFVFGTNDSVGILSNFFPLFISGFNLYLELKHRAQPRPA